MAAKIPTPGKALREVAKALGLERVTSIRLSFPNDRPATAEATIVLDDHELGRVVRVLRLCELEPEGAAAEAIS